MSKKFYGKYRGTVSNNVDPLQLGRIQATVPDVSGSIPTSWALPCVPFAGPKMGAFVVPPVGSGVWIEFEQGNPDYPIWVGGYWGSSSELPGPALKGVPGNPNVVIGSRQQNRFVISDVPGPKGGIVLESATGAKITVNDTGIYIDNGKGAKVTLVGKTVNVNDGALAVT